ncbi:MAG: branched-chain amino acid ABC transporter permease [Armatimonadota bacterium]|nr:branched-chain amino acid ABC transporter permease [Armatimonadota bacterium]MDR7439945.1 branched-chain amino acid ABC transporter permease [Armatimonadota bacterium]MDR7562725.1 branched-chain amino acid ABC transporter permease [Armatimonadota bacterium]MDR7567944.1 branched-chain amino acid ABC transporter permease [Armatimonadota bacterium]MDR7601024.1 branched-chain amino acid ABC transporter permease [Armatimonadota bacterium]
MRSGKHRVWGLHLGVLGGLGVLQFVLPPYHLGVVTRILLFSTYALAYNLLLGYTGLLSLGHALYFAAGMYGAGLPVYYLGLEAPQAFPVGVLGSAVMAALVGIPALRTTGLRFSIVTLLFGQTGYLLTLYFNRITWADQGLSLPLQVPPVLRYHLALLLFGVSLLGSLWIVRSPFGRVLVGLREHEERTHLLGYDPFLYRWVAHVLSGALCGAAGAAYALLFAYVGNAFASVLYSVYPLLWVLVGGAGTALGPLLGVALVTYAVEVASGLTHAYLVVVGAALICLIRVFPQGILGSLRKRGGRWLP